MNDSDEVDGKVDGIVRSDVVDEEVHEAVSKGPRPGGQDIGCEPMPNQALEAISGWDLKSLSATVRRERMKALIASWQPWALLSAVFAAITAIFARVGVEGVNSNYALFVRTIVVILFLVAILATTGQFQLLVAILGVVFLGEKLSLRNWLGVVFMAIGALLVAIRK